ncbi:dual oxidase-like [Diaphorina citri]|uniref:Dual oxidase-like n=1 Tax=Diaphorina citri TaxID=121845 RepID=A0A3Q0IR15_DIACI|nr:dual oxidase-like [Diaphorina citri]
MATVSSTKQLFGASLVFFIINNSFDTTVSEKSYSLTEKQRYDGWFNNLAHPDWGSVGK